jgi:hypothetical protein
LDYRYITGFYGFADGTSFSAPIVSGLASLILSVNPNLRNFEVMDIIKQNTDPLPPAPNGTTQSKFGRVNAKKALQAALNGVRPRDGDAYPDGQGFTLADCTWTLQTAVGLHPQTASIIRHADVAPLCSLGGSCPDGIIDITDAIVMLQVLVEKITTQMYPVILD